MATRCDTRKFDDGLELLHKVRGSVDVARSMIERSTGLCGRTVIRSDVQVLAGLADAADALGAVADAIEEELQTRTFFGPAA